jgi:hypothetical protein
MEPADSYVSRSRAGGTGRSGEREIRRDGHPADDEGSQDPQEERRLGHRQPGKLLAPQEEPCPPARGAVIVELDDLAAHGFGRSVRRPSVAISVGVSRPSYEPQWGHRASLAVSPCLVPERSRP